MSEQITLNEAVERLGIPRGTLDAWRAAGRIYPTGIIYNPRKTRVFDLIQLEHLASTTARRNRHSTKSHTEGALP